MHHARRGRAYGTADEIKSLTDVLLITEDVRRRAAQVEAERRQTIGTYEAIADVRFIRALAALPTSAHPVLLKVLREVKLDANERRKVRESIKFYAASSFKFPKDDPEASGRKLRTVVAMLEDGVRVALAALTADQCAQNECAVAGCFRVVNAGGFDQKVMKRAEDAVSEAAKLVSDAGFSELCYGDAHVTELIDRNPKNLALYFNSSDSMYVRALTKKSDEMMVEVETIVHELGHRLDYKFLSPKGREVYDEFYEIWKLRVKYSKMVVDMSKAKDVVPGFRFKTGRREWVVANVRPDGSLVEYHLVEEPKVRGRTSMEGFIASVYGQRRADFPFPSSYATTNARELFAELFAAVIFGRATAEQRQAFDQINAHRARR